MDLLTPETGTIFWTVITFVFVLLNLSKFAWKPILKTLEDRENRIKLSLDQAEQNYKEAEKYLAEQKVLIKQAKEESVELIKKSKMTAEQTKKGIIEQAKSEADRMVDRAKQEINSSKDAAILDVKKYAADISLLAAQKVVGDTISQKQQYDLIEKYINELSRQE